MIEFKEAKKKSNETYRGLMKIAQELQEKYPISCVDAWDYVEKLHKEGIPLNKIFNRASRQIDYWLPKGGGV
jgi:hypothetical protein